jgi:hypothetical protein
MRSGAASWDIETDLARIRPRGREIGVSGDRGSRSDITLGMSTDMAHIFARENAALAAFPDRQRPGPPTPGGHEGAPRKSVRPSHFELGPEGHRESAFDPPGARSAPRICTAMAAFPATCSGRAVHCLGRAGEG